MTVFNEMRGKRRPPLLRAGLIAAAVLSVALLWLAITALRPLPRHTVGIVTRPDGGWVVEFGKRYRELLAHQGVELRLVPTAGAVENVSRLRADSTIDAGFVLSGVATS